MERLILIEHKLVTPIGNIPFTVEENIYYNSLSDVEVVSLYLKDKKRTGFINPHIFQVIVDRNLLFRGETEKDLFNRYKKLIGEKGLIY